MTITRDQVADLGPGDIIRLHRDEWSDGSFVQGPLSLGDHPSDRGLYVLDGFCCVRYPDGRVYEPNATLTLISRAPRPLYVNHPRRKPVPGDVAALDTDPSAIWGYDFEHDWLQLTQEALPLDAGVGMRLLVDGETGEVVR